MQQTLQRLQQHLEDTRLKLAWAKHAFNMCVGRTPEVVLFQQKRIAELQQQVNALMFTITEAKASALLHKIDGQLQSITVECVKRIGFPVSISNDRIIIHFPKTVEK